MQKAHGIRHTGKWLLAAMLMATSATSMALDASHSPTERHILHLDDAAWINDIGSLLYSDPDADGYFSGLSLSIDADSNYAHHEVFVVVDIIDENNVVEELHTTHRFDVYGRSLSDEYRIDIDLLQNYYPGTYNLQITLVDAHDNHILDQANANNFRNLRALPLESVDNQTVHTPPLEQAVDMPNDDIRVAEYAGSTGFFILMILLTMGAVRTMATNPRLFKATSY